MALFFIVLNYRFFLLSFKLFLILFLFLKAVLQHRARNTTYNTVIWPNFHLVYMRFSILFLYPKIIKTRILFVLKTWFFLKTFDWYYYKTLSTLLSNYASNILNLNKKICKCTLVTTLCVLILPYWHSLYCWLCTDICS